MLSRLYRFAQIAALAFCVQIGPAAAQDRPVVVELFTSQGCSSCPPADRMLGELAAREDVIALALHVDYWDYIGWKDQFGDHAHTQRQKAYAAASGRRSIYTPQMIVQGQDSIVGARGMELSDTIQAHKAQPQPVRLTLERQGDVLRIAADTGQPVGAADIHMLRYLDAREVEIKRGENAGRTLAYRQIVQDWQVVGEWSGDGPLRIETAVSDDRPIVVLIQSQGAGPILAGARLR